jgi:hypothetical protein
MRILLRGIACCSFPSRSSWLGGQNEIAAIAAMGTKKEHAVFNSGGLASIVNIIYE